MGFVRPSRHSRPSGDGAGARAGGFTFGVSTVVTVCALSLALAAMPNVDFAQAAEKRTQTAKVTQDEPTSRPIQSIVALVNDEPITGYEIEQRVALAMLGAPDVQRKLQAKLKAPSMNEQFKAFAMKRLQANPPKSEAEQ